MYYFYLGARRVLYPNQDCQEWESRDLWDPWTRENSLLGQMQEREKCVQWPHGATIGLRSKSDRQILTSRCHCRGMQIANIRQQRSLNKEQAAFPSRAARYVAPRTRAHRRRNCELREAWLDAYMHVYLESIDRIARAFCPTAVVVLVWNVLLPPRIKFERLSFSFYFWYVFKYVWDMSLMSFN